jgi:hypothetical protein
LCKREYRLAWRNGRIGEYSLHQLRQPVQADGRRVCRLVEVCDRRHYSRGLCRPHYMRWQRTGDPQPDVPVRSHLMPFGYYNTPQPKRSPRPAPARLTLDLIDTDEL